MASRARWLALVAVLAVAAVRPLGANPASDRLRTLASDQLFSLDDEQALATWRQATVADPNDPAAWRGLAGCIIERISMLRGTLTVDSYLGRVASNDTTMPAPPADLAAEFDKAVERAIELARQQVRLHPNDAQARYQLGAAVGIRATYMAAVNGSMVSAFRSAREAFDMHERVLALDASRADAGLIVGTYRYLVSTMSLPMRMVAYAVGFGGGRERGIQLVERAAAFSGDNQTDARLALVLLYNREGRYDKALEQVEAMRAKYPRNRLLWLEAGSTLIRAGRPADAERTLTTGIAMLSADNRPRMLGEEALWYYRRGAARAALGHIVDAQADLERAIAARGRPWVEGRAHLELGQIALKQSNPQDARAHLTAAARLGDGDRDGATAARAREMLARLPVSR